MGKYGEAAVRAVDLLRRAAITAEAAWQHAADEMFAEAPAARAKSCQREAFLGLCQHGFLRGVAADRCTAIDARKNREYAAVAARLLAQHPELGPGRTKQLWRRVMDEGGGDAAKRHNQQMDVVLALRARGDLMVS